MQDKINNLKPLIGNTPVRQCQSEQLNLFAKLEYFNFSGSIKDRAVYNIIHEAIRKKKINQHTTLIESSSGNFAISLAHISHHLGLKFIPVVDPNINRSTLDLLRMLCDEVCMVSEKDWTGGYLLSRIEKVQELCAGMENVFWTNQYENEDNSNAYYYGLAPELLAEKQAPDYVFVSVSSCGTFAGLSRRIHEERPGTQVIAVDIEGSIIFGQNPQKRYFSGLGASKRSLLLDNSVISDVVIVSHLDIVEGCRELLKEQHLFAGASSGAAYSAVKKYFAGKQTGQRPNVYFICPDSGYPYLDTVFSQEWVNKHLQPQSELNHTN